MPHHVIRTFLDELRNRTSVMLLHELNHCSRIMMIPRYLSLTPCNAGHPNIGCYSSQIASLTQCEKSLSFRNTFVAANDSWWTMMPNSQSEEGLHTLVR